MKPFCRVRSFVLAVCLLLLNSAVFPSQLRAAAGDVDLSFDAGSGVDRQVNVVAVQADGKVIIGGEFLTVKGLLRPHLARLNADGSGDATFNAGAVVDTYVSAVAVQPDGKVLFARDFYNLSQHPAGSNLRRLNSDGTLDASFVSNTGAFPEGHGISCLALQPDGKMVVGGYFNDYVEAEGGGHQYFRRSLLIRLNADGSLDASFTHGNGIYGGSVMALALQPDGKILISGPIAAEVNGDVRIDTLRLNANGTLDSDFDPGTDGNIWLLAVRPDGKIIAGGGNIWNGTDRSALALLNSDGSLNPQFDPATDPLSGINALVQLPDGKIMIGGPYIEINGVHQNGLARLNADGSVDSGFNPGIGPGAPGNGALAIALQPGGKMIVAGAFTTFDGASRERIARLNTDGSVDSAFDPGAAIRGGIDSIVMLPDGKALIGGDFAKVRGVSRDRIARLHSNGSLDIAFDPGAGISHRFPGYRLAAMTAQSDGRILIGGDSGNAWGLSRGWLARLNIDGSWDSSFTPGIGAIGGYALGVFSIVMQSDGKMLVGGDPALANGANLNGIARLNADGILDGAFNPNTIGNTQADYTGITALAVQTDGKILAGGYYTSYEWNGYVDYLMIRLNADGSHDGGFKRTLLGGEPSGEDYAIYAVALQPDGKVLIGGTFTSVEGASWNGIARLNADGTLDTSFNPGTGVNAPFRPTVTSIVVQPDGKILIGGRFDTFNGSSRNCIARLNADGSVDSTFNPGTGADGVVRAIALQPDGNVIISGEFSAVNGVVRPRIARIYGSTQPPTSFGEWAANFGLSGAAAAADADPDHDGLASGIEFVLSGNPTLPATANLPVLTASAGSILFTFSRVDESETPDVTLTVESGTDLLSWPDVFTIGPDTAASSPGVSISENGTAPDTITVTVPHGSAPRLFARLRVTIAP